MDYIPLKDVILPFIKYDSPILNRVLEDMKDQIVSPGRKGYEITLYLQAYVIL